MPMRRSHRCRTVWTAIAIAPARKLCPVRRGDNHRTQSCAAGSDLSDSPRWKRRSGKSNANRRNRRAIRRKSAGNKWKPRNDICKYHGKSISYATSKLVDYPAVCRITKRTNELLTNIANVLISKSSNGSLGIRECLAALCDTNPFISSTHSNSTAVTRQKEVHRKRVLQ